MKVTGRVDNWPTETYTQIIVDGSTGTTMKLERPVLAAGRAYEACALELQPSGHGYFWLIGEGFQERKEDGLVYPDLVPFEKCEIVEGSISAAWATRLIHAQTGTIVLMGPSAFIAHGFHEKLTDGDAAAVRHFLDFLGIDRSHSEPVAPIAAS